MAIPKLQFVGNNYIGSGARPVTDGNAVPPLSVSPYQLGVRACGDYRLSGGTGLRNVEPC